VSPFATRMPLNLWHTLNRLDDVRETRLVHLRDGVERKWTFLRCRIR
jgi:hypothetical protein